jgi:hypothetical protein
MPQGTFTWTGFYDHIYVVSLIHRVDRQEQVCQEMEKYHIPFEIINAVPNPESPYKGLRDTLVRILTFSLHRNAKRILIFEDDVQFTKAPQMDMLNAQVQLLANDRAWELFYLGLNTHKPLERISENLLKVKNAYALHAVSYSTEGMMSVLDAFKEHPHVPADVAIEQYVQPNGHSYCTFPLLATQRPSFSDIEKKDVNYDFIQARYMENTKHLINI